MGRITRTTAAVLIICLLVSVVGFAENGNIQINDDIEDIIDNSLIEKLSALYLWKGEKLTESVSRANFASIIVRMLGMDDVDLTSETPIFADVDAEHPSYSAVTLLGKLGIVKGGGEARFYPDEPVTYAQAVKMLVSALGYEDYAKVKGGFPAGYIITALEKKIIPRDNSKNINSAMKFADIAVLLDTAIEAPILEAKSYGERVHYVSHEDSTILTEYLDIYTVEGIFEAAGSTRINYGDKLKSDKVEINGLILSATDNNFEDLLGYDVKAYYKKDASEDINLLLYVEENKSHNDVFTIEGDYIEYFELGKIYYRKNDNDLDYVHINSSIDVVINNEKVYKFTSDDIINADKIILIDNNSDGNYDVMRITIEEIMVVSGVYIQENKVYGKYNTGNEDNNMLVLDSKDREIVVMDKAGNPADINSIVAGSVLTVVRNQDSSKIKVIVSNDIIEGVIDEINVSSDLKDKIITMEGKEYRVSKNAEYIENLSGLKAGDECVFYLDSDDRIADIEYRGQNAKKYAYLVKAAKKNGLSNRVEFRLYTINKKFEDFISAENIKINGSRKLSGDEVLESIKYFDSLGREQVHQLIRYSLNSNGEVSHIETAKEVGENELGSNIGFTKYKNPALEQKVVYNESHRTFGWQVRIDENTVVFCVPTNLKYINDILYYDIKYISDYRNSQSFYIEAYDVSEDRTAKVLIEKSEKGGGDPIRDKSKVVVITKITEVVDEEGNTTKMLYGYQDGKEIKLPFDKDCDTIKYYGNNKEPSEIKRGDLIRYGLNSKGQINDYYKLFSLRDENKNPKVVQYGNEYGQYLPIDSPQSGSLLAVSYDTDKRADYHVGRVWFGNQYYFPGIKFTAEYGIIKERVGTRLVIEGYANVNDSSLFTRVCDMGTNPVYMIDEVNDKIYVTTIEDVVPASVGGDERASRGVIVVYEEKPAALFIIKRREQSSDR